MVCLLNIDFEMRLWMVVEDKTRQSFRDDEGEKGPDVRDYSITQVEDLGDHAPRKHVLHSERAGNQGHLLVH